jgi:hypothetical protein
MIDIHTVSLHKALRHLHRDMRTRFQALSKNRSGALPSRAVLIVPVKGVDQD